MLDVPVYTHRAAVHDAFRASGGGRLDYRSHSRGIDRAVSSIRQAGLPVNRGDVIHDVDAADCAIERRAIFERAHGGFDSREVGERGRLCRIADECTNGVAPAGKRTREMATSEAGCPGD
jgi:hypothetical protein